jgi:hypothetical protein
MEKELGCFDCDRPYSKGPDLVIDDKAWAAITRDGAAILCPNCIHDRLEAASIPAGSVLGFFTSGPMALSEQMGTVAKAIGWPRKGEA